jgi:hypothetical protein
MGLNATEGVGGGGGRGLHAYPKGKGKIIPWIN